MKSQRLRRLQAGTSIVLFLYVLLLAYMAIAIPNGATMWADKQWADVQIRGAQTLEQLQAVSHFAASSISVAQQTQTVLLFIFMFATIGTICFLGWSLFVIGRIKKEVSIDHAA